VIRFWNQAIVEFLDKSRSPLSRTNTTSDAPAPSLSPATIAFTATSNAIIHSLHLDTADPDKLAYLNVVDEASLLKIAEDSLPGLIAKRDALVKNLADAESGAVNVTAKVQSFWREKKADIEIFVHVFENTIKRGDLSAEAMQKQKSFLATAEETWNSEVKKVIEAVSKEMIGPFALGGSDS
jgi:hypothetical protein